jgi:carbon storage regulator CsrA
MLLFTRGIGEEILLNQGDIKIKIITTINNKVVIGVQIPRQIQVERKKAFQPTFKDKI